jgi:hypothetical protein
MLKRIHVNKHNILSNRKGNESKPVFTVKTYNTNTYGYEVAIDGPSRMVYSPNKPLSCGAVAWIETRSPVIVDGDNIVL